MNMDNIVLTFKSVTTKMKSDLTDAINKWKSLDNETEKASSSIKNLASPLESLKQKLKSTQDEYDRLNKKVKEFSNVYGVSDSAKQYTGLDTSELRKSYEENNKIANDLLNKIGEKSSSLKDITDTESYNKMVDTISKLQEEFGEAQRNAVDFKQALAFREDVGTSYENAVESLKILQDEMDNTKFKIQELNDENENISIDEKYGLVDKDIKDVGNSAEESSKKFNTFRKSVSSTGNAFSQLGNGIKSVKKLFNGLSNNFNRGMDGTFKKVRKLALGLIGVRTVMSLLTKSVNSYLSFDSELQDSLKNSWNTLGSLLAPAIELVANLFAQATTYVAQFVQALTGINLVARANEKALQSQATASQKAANAQRGLLGMDEITNLPTESAASPVSQIKELEFTPNEFFKSIVDAFKKGNWHILGENVGKSISKALKSIDWTTVRKNADTIGRNIASFFNGWFEFGWTDLGTTAANGLNTVFDILGGFVDDFSFIQFGKGISTALTKFFTDVKWDEVATTLSNGVLGILDTIKAIFKDKKNQDAIGNAIADFVKNIKWFEIGKSIAETIIAGFKAGFNIREAFFKNLFGEDIGGLVNSGITGALHGPIFGLYNLFKSVFPGLDTGTEKIETEGLYHLHQGEMVVPKKYNPSTSGIDTGKDNKQIIDLLVSLNSNLVAYATRPVNVNMDGKKVAEGTYGYLQDISNNQNKSTVVVRS